MDYYSQICHRSCINEVYSPHNKRSEFFRHAGSYSAVKYEHDSRVDSARVLGAWSIPGHFEPVVSRFARVIERYYDELGFPRSAVAAANVSAAIGMATACVEMTLPWMQSCRAPVYLAIEIAERAFDSAKWHFGPVATCNDLMSATQIASANAAMACEVANVRCIAEQRAPRIFA